MEKAALELFSSLVLATDRAVTRITDVPSALVPKDMQLSSLEHLMDNPRRFKAEYNTNILDEFCNYCKENIESDSRIYINDVTMQATGIFDHGTVEHPEWGDHTATLAVLKSPAYLALCRNDQVAFKQRALVDFIEDWSDYIEFIDDAGEEMSAHDAINSILNLSLTRSSQADRSESNFEAAANAMESVKLQSKTGKLPAYFIFGTPPYEGFDVRKFKCILRTKTGENELSISYRIVGHEQATVEIANEFRELIGKQIPDATIHIGTIAHQPK